MKLASSRIWTCVAKSFSYNNNHYTMSTCLNIYIYIYIYIYHHHHLFVVPSAWPSLTTSPYCSLLPATIIITPWAPAWIYIYIYIYIYIIIIIFLSCHQHDPLSLPLPIVHCFRQVLRATPHILTELLYVGSSWLPCFCLAMWRGP